ncbi:MAG: hypothetical protein ABI378_09300, partial [Chitinophagaceae bacterium]
GFLMEFQEVFFCKASLEIFVRDLPAANGSGIFFNLNWMMELRCPREGLQRSRLSRDSAPLDIESF